MSTVADVDRVACCEVVGMECIRSKCMACNRPLTICTPTRPIVPTKISEGQTTQINDPVDCRVAFQPIPRLFLWAYMTKSKAAHDRKGMLMSCISANCALLHGLNLHQHQCPLQLFAKRCHNYNTKSCTIISKMAFGITCHRIQLDVDNLMKGFTFLELFVPSATRCTAEQSGP